MIGIIQLVCILLTVFSSVCAFRSTSSLRNSLKAKFTNRYQLTAVTSVNEMTDKIPVKKFHHVEFYCGDATNTYKRFVVGLGMEFICKSDQSTGNVEHASYVLQSGDMRMVFTAPYHKPALYRQADSINSGNSVDSSQLETQRNPSIVPFPHFSSASASDFFQKHGLGVKTVAVEVGDVTASFNTMIQNGAVSSVSPMKVTGG
jgi:4-hydroxyphenylpyruvate dioxygenase